MSFEKALGRITALPIRSRVDLWSRYISAVNARDVAEIGVLRGAFAASILEPCDCIRRYYMIDPWRHLENWDKPANTSDEEFEHIYAEALGRTERWREKRIVLRGKTAEVIDRIPDETLDWLYVDGDHTLRGITIDLITAFRKVKIGGLVGGDDFCPSIWQHQAKYEPTLVFPFAVHFAEAMKQRIFALPHNQFAIEKRAGGCFEFRDLTGRYPGLGLVDQLCS